MSIKIYNFEPAMVIREIEQLCWMAEFAFERLERGTGTWRGEKVTESGGVIGVFSAATLLLTLAGTISNFLFEGNRGRTTRAKTRARQVRQLLGIAPQTLPTLQSPGVRNSLVHLDERLDETLPTVELGRYSPWYISSDPMSDRVCLKRLDPISLQLWFLDSVVDLRALVKEIRIVEATIEPGIRQLGGDRFELWPG